MYSGIEHAERRQRNQTDVRKPRAERPERFLERTARDKRRSLERRQWAREGR